MYFYCGYEKVNLQHIDIRFINITTMCLCLNYNLFSPLPPPPKKKKSDTKYNFSQIRHHF